MKTILKLALVCCVAAVFGFVSVNNYTKKIEALQKELDTCKKNGKCKTQKVLDKDLAAFYKLNQQDPNINAVLVNVNTLQQALKAYKANDNVYITVTDSDSLGRNIAMIAQFPNAFQGVCHLQGIGARCCPPPASCDPGLANFVQFFSQSAGAANMAYYSTERATATR